MISFLREFPIRSLNIVRPLLNRSHPTRSIENGSQQFSSNRISSRIHATRRINRTWRSVSVLSGQLYILPSNLRAVQASSCVTCRRWTITTSYRRNTRHLHGKNVERHWSTNRIEVPVGGNGTVALDIAVLGARASASDVISHEQRDILVYLPPGPLPGTNRVALVEPVVKAAEQDFEEIKRILLSYHGVTHKKPLPSTSVVVKINYRLAPCTGANGNGEEDFRFPTAIHDVSEAFHWMITQQDELLSVDGIATRPRLGQCESTGVGRRITVFGSHIGGSLALMLALTQPNRIHSVAVQDPIVDWTGFDEIAASTGTDPGMVSVSASLQRRKAESEKIKVESQRAATELINLRSGLFHTPSSFFDPFASPLLFLRAPGLDTPLWRTAKPEIEPVTNGYREAGTEDDMPTGCGDVKFSKDEVNQIVHETGFGPYDDDWHAAESGIYREHDACASEDPLVSEVEQERLDQLAANLSTPWLNDQAVQPSTERNGESWSSSLGVTSRRTLEQPLSDSLPALTDDLRISHAPASAATAGPTLPRRRRKVLRRWPPIGRPEDVELPFTKIYSARPSPVTSDTTVPQGLLTGTESEVGETTIDLTYVLHPQAKEMVDVMRRACFWAREKGVGEERVSLEGVGGLNGGGSSTRNGKAATQLAVDESQNNDDNIVATADENSSVRGHNDSSMSSMQRALDWMRYINTIEK